MTNKKHSRQKQRIKSGKHRIPIVEPIEGYEDLYDEVDKHHKQYDDELLKLVKQPPNPIAKEVLRVAVDESSDEEDEHEELEELQDEAPTTTNKWGKRRRNYYGTSYVDKDLGGVHDSEEEEILELEEEDALLRQKKIESSTSMVNFDQLIDELEGDYNADGRGIADVLQIHSNPVVERPAASAVSNSQQNTEETHNDSDCDEDKKFDDQSIPNDNRRKITYEIRKNKGIRQDKGRRRGKKQHSRVMKRAQYEKALIRRRSQVPDLRREMTKYDGEKRGIRVSTIRSIKLL